MYASRKPFDARSCALDLVRPAVLAIGHGRFVAVLLDVLNARARQRDQSSPPDMLAGVFIRLTDVDGQGSAIVEKLFR